MNITSVNACLQIQIRQFSVVGKQHKMLPNQVMTPSFKRQTDRNKLAISC